MIMENQTQNGRVFKEFSKKKIRFVILRLPGVIGGMKNNLNFYQD